MLLTSQILYNALKHHLAFICETIADHTETGPLLQTIRTLGSSKMDLYTGNLSVSNLLYETIDIIPVDDLISFKEWIYERNDYQTICLSDGSEWILRYAENSKKFIHLHPGRYVPHTFRVNANVIKTAVLTVFSFNNGLIKNLNTQSVNEVRRSYLNLSPIKDLDKSLQLSFVIEKICQSLKIEL